MKVKRLKHARKVTLFYKNYFDFQPPYQILVDGTFCKAALMFKVNISEQMPKYLEAEIQLYTTACVLAECERFGTLLYGPLKVLRQFEVKPCGHREPVSASRCLRLLIGRSNPHKLMLATQDQELTEKCRSSPGIPVLYIAYTTITLEAPSDYSKKSASKTLDGKIAPSDYETSVIKKLMVDAFGEPPTVPVRKKKRGPKGPNPLSCKKKKKILHPSTQVSKKRKKKKKKKVEDV